MSEPPDGWMESDLVCPRDEGPVRDDGGSLVCSVGHRYRCVEGIPVMTLEELPASQPRHWASEEQIEAARTASPPPLPDGVVDPVVARSIVGTHGNLYRNLVNRLARYPIPHFPPSLRAGPGSLLDLGCNWGRWSIAAHHAGYTPIGIDPNFEAVLSARRVARQLGLPLRYVCADARRLPFRRSSVDVVLSYSVLQHLPKADVAAAVSEIARVLRPGGVSWIQMPNTYGIRNLYQQARRGFRRARAFEVRHWTPASLRETFSRIGPTRLLVDGFFTLNPQTSDLDLLPRRYRAVIGVSESLRRLSRRLPPLVNAADSLIVLSTRPRASATPDRP